MRFAVLILIISILLVPLVLSDAFGSGRLLIKVSGGDLSCTPSQIVNSSIQVGQSFTQNITVQHSGSDSYPANGYTVNFTKTSGSPGDWASFLNQTLSVPLTPTINSTIATITIPTGTADGNYFGYVFANSSNSTFTNCTISLNVTVTSVAPPPPPPPPPSGGGGGGAIGYVFDTRVKLEPGSEVVLPGGRVYFTINIVKISGPAGFVDINMTYRISDPAKHVVTEVSETVAIGDDKRGYDFLRNILTPDNAAEGTWTLQAITRYVFFQNTGSTTFTVASARPGLNIVEYPEVVIVRQGDIEFAHVRVENIGGTVIPNVRLFVLGVPSSRYSVTPNSVNIFPGVPQDFVVKFIIPDEATIRDVPIIYRAAAGTTIDERAAILSIRGSTFDLVKIKDIRVPTFAVTLADTVNVTLESAIDRPINATVSIQAPETFILKQTSITKTIEPRSTNSYYFDMNPQVSGLFTMDIKVLYENKEITKQVLALVLPFEVIVLMLIFLIALLILYLRRRGEGQGGRWWKREPWKRRMGRKG